MLRAAGVGQGDHRVQAVIKQLKFGAFGEVIAML